MKHEPIAAPAGAVPSRFPVRIESLDVLRGAAICGILLMNISSMGTTGQYPVSTAYPRWDLELVTWGLQTLFVQGAMRGLFTMLFGASMLLMLRRAEGERGSAAPIDVWTRRAIALMGLGTVQWLAFLWPGEILWNYGVSGLFLLAFRSARPRTMLIAAAVLMAGLSANVAHWTYAEIAELQQGAAAEAEVASSRAADRIDPHASQAVQQERAAIHPSERVRDAEIARRTHYPSVLRWSAGYWTGQNMSPTAWLDIAESISFMLIGMALFRFGILTGAASSATYLQMIAVGYGGGLLLRGLTVYLDLRTGMDLSRPIVGPALWTLSYTMFQPARLLITLGHVGLVIALLRAGALGQARTLRALGRMALTVYCMQSILGSILFYGLGYLGMFELPGLWAIAAGIWAFTALFCRLWLSCFEMGPAERLLRAIAYSRWWAGGGASPEANPV